MTGYILKRLVSAVPVLPGITVIVFAIMALIPGDPATAILGSSAKPLTPGLELDEPDRRLDMMALAFMFAAKEQRGSY
jgi:ABC-type dipeptide/oligopeptide/nickel transport system permease component